MSVVHLVVLPRGRDAAGDLWGSLVWSPLPPSKDGSVDPDPAAVADWPATITRLQGHVRVHLGARPCNAVLDLSVTSSALWRALTAAAGPGLLWKVALPEKPLLLPSYSTRAVRAATRKASGLARDAGVLRGDLPLLTSALDGSATDAAPLTFAEYAATNLGPLKAWHDVVLPDAPPVEPGPPTLPVLLAAAMSRPSLAERLGLIVPVRLEPEGPGPLPSGPVRVTVKAVDPDGTLTFRNTASAPGLIGSSFTLRQPDDTAADHFDASVQGDFDIDDIDPEATLDQWVQGEQLLQPERSRGFEITRHELAKAQVARLSRPREFALETSDGGAGVRHAPAKIVDGVAADVLVGVRVDVADVPDADASVAHDAWRSLMWRRTEVEPRPGAASSTTFPPFVVDDEGSLQLIQVVDHKVDEHIGSWTGWSLGAPRVGLGQSVNPAVQPSPHEAAPLDDPGDLADGLPFRLVVRPPDGRDHPERSLPRLRFGRTYRFRLRPVDVAGWTPPAAEGLVGCSPALTHLRRERIGPPVAVFGSVPSEGETAEDLVIRSVAHDPRSDEPATCEALAARLTADLHYPYTGDTVRHVLPPSTSVVLAEQHGAFDPVVAGTGGLRRSLRVAAKVDGTLSRATFVDTEVEAPDKPADAGVPLGLSLLPAQPRLLTGIDSLMPADVHTAAGLTHVLVQKFESAWPTGPGAPLPEGKVAAYLGKDPLRCPHLPDPAADRLVARLVVAGEQIAPVVLDPYGEHAWPEPRGWRVVLTSGEVPKLQVVPETRTLTVHLPVGRSGELRVTAVPDEQKRPLFDAYVEAADRQAVGTLMVAGRQPQVASTLTLRLRHAVMRPNSPASRPAPLLVAQAFRTPGGADLRFVGDMLSNVETTASIGIQASWSAPGQGGPTSTSSHVAQLDHLVVAAEDTRLAVTPIPELPVAPPVEAQQDLVIPPPPALQNTKDPSVGGWGPIDKGDPYENVADRLAQVSRVDQAVGLQLVDLLGGPLEKVRDRALAGRIGTVVTGAQGAVRTLDLGPLDAEQPGRGFSVWTRAGAPAATAPGGRRAGADGHSGSAQHDRSTTELGGVDLAGARLQYAAESALGLGTLPPTIADALSGSASTPQALLDAHGAGTTSVMILSGVSGRQSAQAEVKVVDVTQTRTTIWATATDRWHHVADTRHLAVTYLPVAHTRYRDCFPREMPPSLAGSWNRHGQPVTLQVPASVAPPLPRVTRLISAVHEAAAAPVVGGPSPLVVPAALAVELPGLRVYLGSTWFASGFGEKLGVVVLDQKPPQEFPEPSSGPVDPDKPRPVRDVLSVLGSDPWTKQGATPAPRTVRYLRAADLVSGEPLAAGVVGDPEATTHEPGILALPQDAGKLRAGVIAHPVRWSHQRGQWYADLRFTGLSGHFVRLSLCRFQPWGLVRPTTVKGGKDVDVRCSATLGTEFVWLDGTMDLSPAEQ